jgi:hypothetical protein
MKNAAPENLIEGLNRITKAIQMVRRRNTDRIHGFDF